jgi:hypothetical protein
MKDYLRILMPSNSETDAPELANGDSAPYIRKMDRRLIVLETRFDSILPTLATKADLVEMKGELKADISELRAELRFLNGEARTEMRGIQMSLKDEMHSIEGNLQKELVKLQQKTTNVAIGLMVGLGGLILTVVTVLRPN